MEMILGYKDAYSSFNIVNSSLVKTNRLGNSINSLLFYSQI